MIDEASFNKETEEAQGKRKVQFCRVKIQLTSFGLSVPYKSSKALVSSTLHEPEVAIFNVNLHKVSWLCHVMNASPTNNYIPIHIDPLQSTYQRWIDPNHLWSTFNPLLLDLDQVQIGSI